MTMASSTDHDIARGKALFKGPCTFVKGVVQIDDLPQDGRPGRTREQTCFPLGKDEALTLVDMPGYGYARAPQAQVKGWTRLVRDYLRGRRELKRVFLLIDARHGIKPNDRETIKLMDEAAVSYQVVLTKADKPKATELETVVAKVAEELARHPAAYPQIVITSARAGLGIPELRAAVAALAPNDVVPGA